MPQREMHRITEEMLWSTSILDRFWPKVDKSGDCWVWTAGTSRDGYGIIRARVDRAWVTVRAHRVSWVIENGTIPDGLLVLHSCDNPSCVNSDHLWLGTEKDNHRDSEKKGRSVSSRLELGSRCHNGHKYTTESTYLWKRKSGRTSRCCRICRRSRGRAAYWKKKFSLETARV